MPIINEFMSNIENDVSTMRFDKAAVLYEAALTYLGIVERVSDEIEAFEYALQAAADLRRQIREVLHNPKARRADFMKNDVYQQLDKYRTEILKGDAIEELYAATFEFQQVLNYVLDQKSVMVYVTVKDGKPQIIQFNEMDFISFGASSSNQLTGRFNMTKRRLTELQDKVRVIDPAELEGVDLDRLAGLQDTYNEVLRRFQLARQIDSDMVLWNIGNEWYGMRVSGGEGDINEAYVSFAMLNNEIPTFQEEMEENVEDYMTDTTSGVGVVDNVSGLLQGDVSVNGIEYAVKSAGASTLGLKQVIELATIIKNKSGRYTEEELRMHQQALADLRVCRDTLYNAEEQTRLQGLKEIANSIPASDPLGAALRASIANQNITPRAFRAQVRPKKLDSKKNF